MEYAVLSFAVDNMFHLFTKNPEVNRTEYKIDRNQQAIYLSASSRSLIYDPINCDEVKFIENDPSKGYTIEFRCNRME